MKLMLILTVVALSRAAKLDRTYLPPLHAQSSGGSGFLHTPVTNSAQFGGIVRHNSLPQNSNNFAPNGHLSHDYTSNRNGNNYARNGNDFVQNGNFGQTAEYKSNGYELEARPERPQAALERNSAILRQNTENDGEQYSYAYETENGIYGEETGVATHGVRAQGGFSYTGDDGQVYSIRYTADENGFVPQGEHLPTAPPVPEEIQRALEQNARDEAAGIYDDGAYDESKYGDNLYNINGNYNNNGNDGFYNGNNGFNNGNNGNNYHNRDSVYGNTDAFTDNDSVVVNSAALPGFRSQSAGTNAVSSSTKAYLPPVSGNTNRRNGFGSRRNQPSFNARTGYRY